MLGRRTFTKNLLGTTLSYLLFDSLFAVLAFDRNIQPITTHWVKRLHEICQDLKLKKLPQVIWQQQVESLLAQIELKELLQFIDFERLIKGMEYPDLGVATQPVVFPKLEGLPERTIFVKKIFGMKKGRAIIPHGHSNMASAHLVLRGEFHMRHYEKVDEQKNYLLIRPSIDRVVSAGDCSSISDERDNVHWFIANTDSAFTFDVIMLNLNEQGYNIQNIDIQDGEHLPNGLIRANKLNVETALKKYGKQHH